MVSSTVRKVRCDDLLIKFMDGGKKCVFLTLTTPDVVDISEIRLRWRGLRHYLCEVFGGDAKYVMNYEIHPKGHGWHIHSVWNRYIPLRRFLPKIRSFGFGRVNVEKVTSIGVADYLSKHCLKAYRGISRRSVTVSRLRLVNTSRGLPRLSDYVWFSDFRQEVHHLMVDLDEKSTLRVAGVRYVNLWRDLPFVRKWRICELCVLMGLQSPSEILPRLYDIINGDFVGLEKQESKENDCGKSMVALLAS